MDLRTDGYLLSYNQISIFFNYFEKRKVGLNTTQTKTITFKTMTIGEFLIILTYSFIFEEKKFEMKKKISVLLLLFNFTMVKHH